MAKILLSIFTAVLLVIALLGIGAGIITVMVVAKTPGASALGTVGALVYGSIPFAIGTVALGAAAIVGAIDQASRDQVAAINRGTEVAINEAKLAQHHRQ